GVRDRITAGRMQQISQRITAQFDASLNRYRMANQVLARTYGANAGVNYVIRRQYPTIELDYLFDIEKHADHRPYAGFPLSNRNVYAIGTVVATPIGTKSQLLASLCSSIKLVSAVIVSGRSRHTRSGRSFF